MRSEGEREWVEGGEVGEGAGVKSILIDDGWGESEATEMVKMTTSGLLKGTLKQVFSFAPRSFFHLSSGSSFGYSRSIKFWIRYFKIRLIGIQIWIQVWILV